MRNQKIKALLDGLAKRYETEAFIASDPIKFPRAYYDKGDFKNAEAASFLCSTLAWGNRKMILNDCDRLINTYMGGDPYHFIKSGELLEPKLVVHRTIKGKDINYIIKGMKLLYQQADYIGDIAKPYDMPAMFIEWVRERFIMANGGDTSIHFPSVRNSTAKRIHMMLRWLVRKGSPVDMGFWQMSQSLLMIPIDTHVWRVAHELKLTERKSMDEVSVKELTETLQEFNIFDPIKYDFALFGYGVNRKEEERCTKR